MGLDGLLNVEAAGGKRQGQVCRVTKGATEDLGSQAGEPGEWVL